MRSMRVAAWATLATQIIIVGTGGAVRLTGSGLGCSSWPNCTEGSFVPTAELGVHGIIEFSNRAMGAVVVFVAIWMLALAILHRRERNVVGLAASVVGVTLLQAVIGGISVWVQLLPILVGIHFVISAVLVVVATVLVFRVVRGPRAPLLVGKLPLILTHVMTLVLAIVVIVGVLTTGSGPHAGDADAVRNGLNPQIMQHVHAIPAYVLFALTIVLGVFAVLQGPALHRNAVIALFVLELLQIAVGLVQSNLGLPVLLVGIHMILAVLTASAGTVVVLALRDPAGSPPSLDDSAEDARVGALPQ